MRIHPFIAAAAAALVGATALCAHLIAEQGRARQRHAAPRPIAPDETAPSAPLVVVAPEAPVPTPEPDEEEDEPTGTLRVRVIGPHGLVLPDAEVSATRPDDPDETTYDFDDAPEEDEDDDDDAIAKLPPGTHVLANVEPGRYDVTVEAPGMRTLHVKGLPTGDEVVTISLARTPILFGSIGPGPANDEGEARSARLFVHGPEEEDGDVEPDEVSVQDDGSFVLEDLPEEGPLTVGWLGDDGRPLRRALVTLPEQGDPASVCFAPSCATAPASVAVYVADATGRLVGGASLEWTLVGDETRGEIGGMTMGGGGLRYLHGRRAGETLQLVATVDDERAEATVRVGAGVTDVVLSLPVSRLARRSP